MKAVKIVPGGIFLFLFSCASSFAQTLLSGFQSAEFGAGWILPMGVLFNKTGTQAFVWEKAGKVHYFSWNAGSSSYIRQTTPLIDISEEVGNWGDHGLMSIALDPAFSINGYIYLLYAVDRHHLLYFGKAGYSPTSNEYYNATIGRVTRYKVITNGMNELVMDPASRKILIGESKSTGMAITHDSHGCGSLVFASDSTLLVSMGDGASYAAGLDSGSNTTSYWQQAITDSIIRTQENVGAFRAQMVNCHNGKLLRIDPATGDGIPNNPFYLAGSPRAARSRVWAMGLRNTFRFTVRPNTGASQRTIGDIGQIYAGEVGNGDYEELNLIDGPGYNCGWPIFEGILSRGNYDVVKNLPNKDEPNPLYGTGGCTQQYFSFQNLLKQATADNNTTVYNPCNTSQAITGTIGNRYFHRVPLLDWDHWNNNARVKVFSGNLIGAANIGTTESGVTGTPFKGNSSSGGCWYQGNLFPSNYKNTFLMADYGANWIKQLTIDASGKLTRVDDFASGFQGIIQVVENPLDGSLFCVDIIAQEIYRVSYGGNKPPFAKISADKNYSSATSLTVNFTGSNSYDPEGGAISYSWNFGDGTANSTLANPSHLFSTGTNTTPRKYVVVLTVRDNQNSISTDSIIISLNNTPPSIQIVSPANNSLYAPTGTDTTYILQANVTDAEQGSSQLFYQWQTFLRHNTHEHPGAIDTNKTTTAVISRVGCNGDAFHWLIRLTVTDAAGLITVDSSKIFPSCVTSPPGILIHPQSQSACEGTAVTFTSAVSDNPPPPVQWQVSINGGSTWTNIPGATNSSYTFTPVAADNGKRFRAVWTNTIGSTSSNAATLTVNSQPAAPTGLSLQTFCFTAAITDLTVSGTSIKWYSSATGGTALSGTTSLVNGYHYYASQTVSGCESGSRLDVTVSVSPTSNPSVFLDGSSSGGVISNYQWSLVSGPNSPVFSTPAAATTNVSGLAPGTYVFRLSLNSGVSTSQVLVNVNPPDTPLVSHAGYDRSVALPASSIILNGSGSRGAIASYSWSRVSGPNVPTIATPTSVSTSVSGLVQGTYAFELLVKDAQNVTRRDTVSVTVTASSNSGTAPVINATHTASSSTGTTVNTLNSVSAGSLLALSVSQAERTSTLFTAAQAIQPSTADASNDGQALELGMRFRSSEDGYITGIRFYKALNNTGTHTGELYTSTGTRLAQAIFTGETASGWQQVNFSTPVFITKGTTYIAAYHSSAGFFSRYTNYFQNSITEGALTGLADGIDGSNGLYGYSSTPAFPTQTYAKTNYWVDVVFARAHATVSSTPSLVWTRRSDAQGIASSGNAELYTARYAAGGNISITTSWGSGSLSTAAYSISNYDTSMAGVSASVTGQSAPSVTVTSSRSNSLLLAVTSDRNGVSGTSRSYRDAATETFYNTSAGVHSAYHYRKASTTAGSYTEGLTAPTGMSAGTALWEVMGLPGPPPDPVADAGYNQTLLAALAPTGQAVQQFYSTATVADLKATGSNIKWYAAASGGTPLTSSTLLDSNKHYYATQTVNNCESILRLDVLALVKPVPGDLAVGATVTDVLCYLDSSGTITASGSGGIPPYTYRLNAGSYQSTGLFTGLKADTGYTVYVRDSIGVIVSTKATVRQPQAISVSTTPGNITCTSPTGTLNVSATGGTPGYVYALNSGSYQRNSQFSDLSAGTYSVKVKDTNNCVSGTVNVSIQNTSTTQVRLSSGSTGTISTYAWTQVQGPVAAVIDSPGRPSTTVRGLVQGSYVFELSVNGGVSRSRVQVNVGAATMAVKAHAGFDRQVYLPIDSVLLDGNASTGTITGYLWSLLSGPGNTPALSNNAGVTTMAKGLMAGVYAYRLQVKDGTGNYVSSDTVLITVNTAAASAPVITASNAKSNNTGNTVTNSLTGVATNGLLVLSVAQSNDFTAGAAAAVSSTPALTWTKRSDANVAGSGNAEIWTAVLAAGGKISVTTVQGQAKRPISTVLYAITGYDPVNTFGSQLAVGAIDSIRVPISTTLSNSLVMAVSSDLKAVSGAARVYLDSAVESLYHFKSAVYTGYHYRKATRNAGNYRMGLSAPSTGTSAGTALLEVRGVATTAVVAYAGANQGINCGNIATVTTIQKNNRITSEKAIPDQKVETLPSKINVFPNPGPGVFRIVGQRFKPSRIILHVMDSRGKVILRLFKEIRSNEFDLSMDLSNFANGIYLLKLDDGHRVHAGKIIKLD